MKPYVIHEEDGGLLVEWVSERARFSISLSTTNIEESGWYYVNKDGTAEMGDLPYGLLEYLADPFVQGRIVAFMNREKKDAVQSDISE